MHADQIPASRMVGNALRRVGETGQLTDQNVVDSTTLVSLQAKITAATGHADQHPQEVRANRILDIGGADGTLSEAIITAATGVANLATNTQYDRGRTYGSIDT